jgi:protein O-mannosyl-transferase
MSRKHRKQPPVDAGSDSPPSVASRDPFPYASLTVCGLLLAAVFLVFGQTIQHGYANYDDRTYICENRYLTEGSAADKIAWAFTTDRAANWHPLTWLSHLLDYSIYGLKNPGGHHLTSVLLHAASAILLFLALRRMTGDFWPSALAAALFAVHPLRVESVAWLAERKDVLSGLFFMLTLWAYARYTSHSFSFSRYFAVAAFFALGLLAKPTLVTLPCVLLLLDYWPLERFQRQSSAVSRLILEKLPLFLVAAASCAMTLRAQHTAIEHSGDIALPWRIGNAVVAYVAYLIQFFWPFDLAVMYPHPGDSLSPWAIAASAVALTAISVGVVMLRRRSPYLATGWLWYLGMLVPMIGLVQVGFQSRADRYTYLPQIGVCLMVAWSIRQAAVSEAAKRRAFVAASAALGILIGVAHQQAALWRDDETLWKHTLACTANNSTAHYHFGMAMVDQGRFDDAVEQYEKAKQIAPNDAKVHNNLGYALAKTGRIDDAIVEYNRSLAINPNLVTAHANLGVALRKKGRIDEAVSHFNAALKVDPDYAMAHNNLGAMLQEQGKLAQAILHYQKAVELQPNYDAARRNLDLAIRQLYHTPESLVRWREWIDLLPREYVLINQAAWLMATSSDASLRNGQNAVELARRAVHLAGENEPTTLDTLAAAYAEAERFSDAVTTARRALSLAVEQNKQPLVEPIQARLRLFKAKKPYHGTPTKDDGIRPSSPR